MIESDPKKDLIDYFLRVLLYLIGSVLCAIAARLFYAAAFYLLGGLFAFVALLLVGMACLCAMVVWCALQCIIADKRIADFNKKMEAKYNEHR